MLSQLKELNMHLTFIDPWKDGFSKYGRFLGAPGWSNLLSKADELIPRDKDPAYIASVEELETLPVPSLLSEVFGAEDAQIGICRGFNNEMNGMEWHDCPEILVAVTPLLLILGHVDEIKTNLWNSRHARVCYLEAGEAVILNAGTLHFAPCRSGADPFLSLIILPRGVNDELKDGLDNTGDNPLLWKERKWILTHRDSPQAANGAPVGISGPNLQINTL